VQRDFDPFEDYTGRLEGLHVVEVGARRAGVVSKVAVKPGAQVKKGDLLFVIDAKTYKAELATALANLAAARARQARAEADWQRVRQLFVSGAITQNESEKAALEAPGRPGAP